jgi:hypothetical protein
MTDIDKPTPETSFRSGRPAPEGEPAAEKDRLAAGLALCADTERHLAD